MKKQLSGFLIFLFVSCAFAQSPPELEQNLRKHIEYLASDKLEGRRTGESGATAAAKYVAEQFKKSRLKPGLQTKPGLKTFLQPFPYISGVTLGLDNSLRIVPFGSGRENKMEAGVNWMPLGYSPNADIPSTEIVFAGFGVVAPEANYDDYKDLDVKDKIVLIFDTTPDAGNPHSAFGRFDIHTKANIAKDKGAKAIILIAVDNDFKNDRLARLSYDRTLGETALPVVGILRGYGAQLIGAAGEAEMNAIAEWLTKKTNSPPFKTMKATAQIKINLVKKQVDAYNVIGVLEGTDPQLKNEAIIIGAHYDHLGHGGSGSLAANSTDIHHGADDNASGTAAVIELARQFAKEKKNKRTMIFMAF
ncbi:MAG TPA: M28 family peptidase, partial [Pyrinomonadaceae bacterium]|nr:M28 family peptidase [Pyrinomonadaceae bacterium]